MRDDMSIEDNEYIEFDNKDERSIHERVQIIDRKLEAIEKSTDYDANLHYITPSVVFHHLKPLNESNKEIVITEYSEAIERLFFSIKNPSKIRFTKLSPNQQSIPRWLREIYNNLELNRKEIEKQITIKQRLSGNLHTLKIGISNSKLYIWQRNFDSSNWLNI